MGNNIKKKVWTIKFRASKEIKKMTTSTKKKWHKSNKAKYFFAGALFGICFPIIAVSIDIIRLGMSFSMQDILWVQSEFPIHLIINTAPIFLGLFALVGGIRQDEIEALNNGLIQEIKVLNDKLLQKVESQEQELITSSKNLKETQQEKNRMETDLTIARDIQLSMLPLIFPAFPYREDINVYAELIPAKEVGGDFYDFYFLDEDNLAFVVGDVSGKGVPAALMMAVCKTILKSTASTERSTAKILTHVNHEMSVQNKNYMFVTVFMAILNTRTGDIVYTNAGHNPTILKKKNGEFVKLADLHGPALAAVDGIVYEETSLKIEQGDALLAYTDGITEAHNSKNELFSEERLDALIKDNPFVNPETTVKQIIKEIKDFEGNQESFDDITALCIQFVGSEEVAVYYSKLLIGNQLPNINLAIEKFEEFAAEHGIPDTVSMQVNIVLDELLANIINYGFLDEEEHVIDIEIRFNGEKLIIIFSDDGIPFNPFEKTPPDTELSISEREIGGLGVHIVKKLMDDYSYKRTIGKNVISITKRQKWFF